jgi:hypothetical protein
MFVLDLQLQVANFVAVCAVNFAVLADVPDIGAAAFAAPFRRKSGLHWLHSSEFDNLCHSPSPLL